MLSKSFSLWGEELVRGRDSAETLEDDSPAGLVSSRITGIARGVEGAEVRYARDPNAGPQVTRERVSRLSRNDGMEDYGLKQVGHLNERGQLVVEAVYVRFHNTGQNPLTIRLAGDDHEIVQGSASERVETLLDRFMGSLQAAYAERYPDDIGPK